MLKNVFTRLFRSSTTSGSTNNRKYERAPIYAIPTISQSFNNQSPQSSGVVLQRSSSTCLEDEENSSQRSTSSISSTTSSSSSSRTTIESKYAVKSPPARLNESTIQQIYIAPHCIHYTNSTADDTIYRIDDESLNEIAAEILESDNCPPKLQIVLYEEKYFAINNSHLQIYKQLQLSGLITHVQADLISIDAIPYALRQYLFQPSELVTVPTRSNSSNQEECDDDIDEIEDGVNDDEEDEECLNEEARPDSEFVNSATVSSSVDPACLASILNADVLSPSTIEMLSKEMLVDETYEFGACENCVESEDDEQVDGAAKNQKKSSSPPVTSSSESNRLGLDENLRLKLKPDCLTKANKSEAIQNDLEIRKYLSEDDGNFLIFCIC